MNRTGIEKALKNAVNSAPELSFEQLAQMPFIRMQEDDYITRQTVVRKTNRIWRYTMATACCLVLMFLISGWYMQNVVASIITLDVNPSIEIAVNHKDRVLSVRALNEDASVIIGNSKYKGRSVSDVVPLLMNSLVEHQYINKDKNAILLTVTGDNSKKADVVKDKVNTVIHSSLKAMNVAPTVLSQSLTKEKERTKLAKQYGISEGKLSLIQDIITKDSMYSIKDLADKQIEELLNLANANSTDLSKYLKPEENKPSGNDNQGKSGKNEDVNENTNQNNNQNGSDKENQQNNDSNENNQDQNSGNEDQGNRNQDIKEQDSQDRGNENNQGKGHSNKSDKNVKKNNSTENNSKDKNTKNNKPANPGNIKDEVNNDDSNNNEGSDNVYNGNTGSNLKGQGDESDNQDSQYEDNSDNEDTNTDGSSIGDEDRNTDNGIYNHGDNQGDNQGGNEDSNNEDD